ncbi:MAG: hypothetical protein DLM53_07465 [Candidatus Eremiobacter antarcticus]|nr:MAG: hypothetical protein DLM53_07465 [Candidatus Eremiobacter sp. RRmetagenome_bin22]
MSHTGAMPEKLGTVHFPISCSPIAAAQFERAVGILHSFGYPEAAEAFNGVAHTDPTCAMAYWGVAMTYYHQMWEPPDIAALAAGWQAAETARKLGAKTRREKDYIAAIDTFYKNYDTLDYMTRALAYTSAMERLYARYPDDREAAIFYALALDATAPPTDKTYANQRNAGAILEKIFVEQPDHPGVAHYIIHADDYPPLAQEALPAARRYAQIAPSMAHALHMPSHIFTRLGLWDESIASNLASANAIAQSISASSSGAASTGQQLHALDYLEYAYLQTGQVHEAKAVADRVAAIQTVMPQDLAAAYGIAAIPARYAIELGHWAEAAKLPLNLASIPKDKYPWCVSTVTFARAIGLARMNNPQASSFANELAADVARLKVANQLYWASEVQIEWDEADGWIAHAAKKDDVALADMRKAVALEDSTEKHAVTPGPIEPAHEMLGDLLLATGEPRLALAEYEASLRISPNRFHALACAARAAYRSGDTTKARTYYAQLVMVAKHADPDVAPITEAKAFLAAN